MDIIDLIINKIGFVLFIILIIFLIYSAINYKLSEKILKNSNKTIEQIKQEIKEDQKYYNKYQEYKEFLKSNNFENNYSMEDNARELELCNKFLENNPDFNDRVLSQKVWLLLELEKYDEAFKNYEIIIKKHPNDDHTFRLAECYAGIDNKEKAFELLENRYKKEEKDTTYYITLGRIYFILKDYNKAIENFSTAIELDKTSPYGETVFPYYNRAKAYKEINDIEKYNSDIEEIEKIKENARKRLEEL